MVTKGFSPEFIQCLPIKIIDRAKEIERLLKIKRPDMPFDPTMFIKACIMISCQENNHPMPELPSSNLSNAVLKIRKTCSLTYVPKLEPFLVRMSWTNTDLSQVRNLVQSVLDHRGSNSTFTLEEQFRWEVVTLFVLYGRKQSQCKRACLETTGLHSREFDAMVNELKVCQLLLARPSQRQRRHSKTSKEKDVQTSTEESEFTPRLHKFCRLIPLIDPRTTSGVQLYLQWEAAFLKSMETRSF